MYGKHCSYLPWCETPPFFHIPICSSLNLDELIRTSPVSVRAPTKTTGKGLQ